MTLEAARCNASGIIATPAARWEQYFYTRGAMADRPVTTAACAHSSCSDAVSSAAMPHHQVPIPKYHPSAADAILLRPSVRGRLSTKGHAVK